MNNGPVNPRFKRVATLLAIGAAIPAIAFFVGVQSGGGENSTAEAASSTTQQQPDRRPPGGPLGDANFAKRLADKLGVSESDLESALDSYKQTLPDKPSKDQHVAELASALGVSQSDLQTALDKLRATQGPPPGGPRGFGHGPGGPDGPDGPGDGQFTKDLANALNVDVSKVKAGFAKLQAAHKAEMDKHKQDLAKYLAGKLNLSEDKVTAALDALRPPAGPHGPPPSSK